MFYKNTSFMAMKQALWRLFRPFSVKQAGNYACLSATNRFSRNVRKYGNV